MHVFAFQGGDIGRIQQFIRFFCLLVHWVTPCVVLVDHNSAPHSRIETILGQNLSYFPSSLPELLKPTTTLKSPSTLAFRRPTEKTNVDKSKQIWGQFSFWLASGH